MARPPAIHPALGSAGARRDVWLLYRPETGGIHKVFLTAPDPAALGAPAGYVLGRFPIDARILARVASYRVRRGRLVLRGAGGP